MTTAARATELWAVLEVCCRLFCCYAAKHERRSWPRLTGGAVKKAQASMGIRFRVIWLFGQYVTTISAIISIERESS